MKKLFAGFFLIVLAGASFVFARAEDDNANNLDRFDYKVRQIQLYNLLLPALLTKDELHKILPAIEKARQKVKDVHKTEVDLLKPLLGKVNDALKAAAERGAVPPKELVDQIAVMRGKIAVGRYLFAQLNTQDVFDVVKKTVNAGQFKVIANSLNPKDFDPKAKPDEMTQDEKVEMFVKEVLLNTEAYDLLVKMSM